MIKASIENFTVDAGWVKVKVALIRLEKTLPAEAIASLNQGETLVIGLPGETYDPCSLSLAYLYTLEDYQMEHRVRNRAILFLINLMGLKQIRDVVERVEEVKAIALIGRGDLTGRLEDTIKTLNIEISGGHIDFKPASCNINSLEPITLARLQRL